MKREYETNEKARLFVCFVSFRLFRILSPFGTIFFFSQVSSFVNARYVPPAND